MATVFFPPAKNKIAVNPQPVPNSTPKVITPAVPQIGAKIEKKSKKELKQQVSLESGTTTPSAKVTKKTNTKSAKACDKAGSRKQSSEDIEETKIDEDATRTKLVSSNNAKLTKAAVEASNLLKVQKKKNTKKSTTDEIASITKSTKDMSLSLSNEKVKKEKKKVKAPKYEYADPNYKVNKFDLLDLDDDEDYYLETSSDDEDSVTNVVAAKPFLSSKNSVAKAQASKSTKENQPINDASKKTSITSTNSKSSAVKAEKPSAKEKATPLNQKSQNIATPALPTVSVNSKAQELEGLSKKQKKKKLVEHQRQEVKESIDNSVNKAEKMAKSLNDSMSRLHLNSDTTIELVKDTKQYGNQVWLNKKTLLPMIFFLMRVYMYLMKYFYFYEKGAVNVSIMDQLNRGVKVEGLMLPPGITLTRVDPSTAESLRAKKESIGMV